MRGTGPASGESDPLMILQARLLAYPQVRYTASSGQVVIHPLGPTGFGVALTRRRDQWVVHCDGWHEAYPSADEALKVALLALSPASRLVVSQRGSFRHRWRFEIRDHAEWRPVSEVGLLFYPFWRKPTLVTLQNRVLQAA